MFWVPLHSWHSGLAYGHNKATAVEVWLWWKLCNCTCIILSRHITTRSSTRSLRSSSAPLLHVPFRRTSFGKLSFSTAAPSVWNSLPVSVHNCDTLTLFKSRIKAHLFSSGYACYLSCSPASLKPRQYGALEILYCIVLYCMCFKEIQVSRK